jgi:hypothetical protein
MLEPMAKFQISSAVCSKGFSAVVGEIMGLNCG